MDDYAHHDPADLKTLTRQRALGTALLVGAMAQPIDLMSLDDDVRAYAPQKWCHVNNH